MLLAVLLLTYPSISGSALTWITTKIQFKQGQQNLNGEEALAYVRMRKQDPNGDYGRAARQRQLLAAVAHKLNSTSTVFKIKDLAAVVGKYIKPTFLFQTDLLFTIKFLDLILLQCKR